jgi:hypothetical protein
LHRGVRRAAGAAIPRAGKPANEQRPLSVRSGGGEVLAPEVIASGTPIEIATRALAELVGGETIEGELVVRSASSSTPTGRGNDRQLRSEDRPGRLAWRRAASTPSRVTLAIKVESGEVLIRHGLVRDVG